MIADNYILNFSKVSLETKDLLPEYSGIYYVVDEENIVWYIGKAKNIRKRWQGKSHHRSYQFENQKQKSFNIYYEQIDISQLDKQEKQQIRKYNPHLNNSSVKNKKIRPTETLLRETIATISDFSFILGVEPPRREVKDQINIEWLVQKKILDFPIIHICLDMNAFKEKFPTDSINADKALIIKPFKTRKAYANKWECLPKISPTIFNLIISGYLVEISQLNFWIEKNNIEKINQYNQTTIAEQSIRVLAPESLHNLQHNYANSESKKIILQRLSSYNSDIIPLLFNETINLKAGEQQLYKLHNDYVTGKKGVGSRFRPIKSKLISSDFTTIDELLISRGIDLNKYQEYKFTNSDNHKRIDLYVQPFNIRLHTIYSHGRNLDNSKIPYYNSVVGILDNKKVKSVSCNFDIVYLLSSVERKAWLLVENYLKDFAEVSKIFKNKEGFTKKFYISPRKYITHAKVNIKLEKMQYSTWIPFGMSTEYPSFEAAKEEIKTRLTEADLPYLKLSFKKESITK